MPERHLRRPGLRLLSAGGHNLAVAQIEGVAEFPAGEELERVREAYFVAYPDERLVWPGITHVRVRPTWVRVSDFTAVHRHRRVDRLKGQ